MCVPATSEITEVASVVLASSFFRTCDVAVVINLLRRYPHCTRKTKNGYAVEMADDDHIELLAAIKALDGLVMISGKSCALYDDALKWRNPCR